MARYNGEDYEDLDEYEEEGDEQEEEGNGEEEYEEEEENEDEAPRHTQEGLEYLQLRQNLKEDYRKQIKKESGSSIANTKEKKNLPYANFGSFFGPSQPVIAPRVIQESKSLLENQHLAPKVSRPHHDKNRSSTSTTAGPKAQAHVHHQENKVKVNAKIVKQTRDYSFLLSDDAALPTPTKDPPPRHVSVSNSDVRSAQVQSNGRQSLNKTVRQVPNGRQERKSMSTGSQMHPKAGSHKLTSASRPILTSVGSSKNLGNSHGSGPGRPLGPKDLDSKKPAPASDRRVPTAVVKNSQLSAQKPPSSKLHSSASKQPSIVQKHVEQKKESQEYRKEKMNRPPAKISSRPSLDRPKKKAVRQYSDDEDDESGRAISMIRSMFGYNPKKYADRDDDSDSDMEAKFSEILEEEKRSAKIARKEDEEEFRKIEEEERRERLRKKRKLR